MSRRIVVGDIHGCAFTFEELLLNKCKIKKDDEIYLVGDYIDRGPRSKRVIDFILKLRQEGFKVYTLKGNHEQMMKEAKESEEKFKHWLKNGGKDTLRSFDASVVENVPQRYFDFLSTLDYYYILENYVIVHGGMNFDIPDPFKDISAMLWIRNDQIDLEKTMGRKLIVGHTPVPINTIKASLHSNQIMIDGGCVYSEIRPDLGILCALELGSLELFTQENLDY